MLTSDCSEEITANIGSSVTIKSRGYPNPQIPGTMCSWTFKGNNSSTWFLIKFIDVDLGDNGTCANYLTIDSSKVCRQPEAGATMVVRSSTFVVGLYIMASGGGRGMLLTIEGKNFQNLEQLSLFKTVLRNCKRSVRNFENKYRCFYNCQ